MKTCASCGDLIRAEETARLQEGLLVSLKTIAAAVPQIEEVEK